MTDLVTKYAWDEVTNEMTMVINCFLWMNGDYKPIDEKNAEEDEEGDKQSSFIYNIIWNFGMLEGNVKFKTKRIECPICLDVIETGKLKLTNCGHIFCQECYDRIDVCALCRQNLNKNH